MSEVVIDASLFGPLIIPDEASSLDSALMPILIDGRGLVPQHWRLELANLGLSALRRQRVSKDNLLAGLAAVEDFGVETDDATSAQALRRTLRIALEHGLTSYGAAYLELAQRRGLPLLTSDIALAEASKAAGVEQFPR